MKREYELIVTYDKKYRPNVTKTRIFGQAMMNARTSTKLARLGGYLVKWYIRRDDGIIVAQSK